MEFKNFLYQELMQSYQKARVGGKRKTQDEHRFEMNDIENISRLRDAIIARKYKPSRGVAFIIHDPVTREVVAAPFIDRVVHHFLYKYTSEWWERRFINASYSCRKGKGTLYGIKDLQRRMRRVSENGTRKTIVVKCDLRGYFMSLDHTKLYERVRWGLERQFPNGGELYRTLKYLWREIIFDELMDGIKIRGRREDWADLPADKSLFFQPKGRGIVIGNLTSQLLSNIFLDQLDRFVTLDLGYKQYGRYVDDFYFVIPADEMDLAREDLEKIVEFLEGLGLMLHPKKLAFISIMDGVEFLGARVYWDHVIPGKRIKKKFASAVYRLATTGVGKLEGIGSYDGHLAHYDSHKMVKKIYDGVGWDYSFPKMVR